MTLIDRYIYEIGRHLPRKNREDILAELRSSMTDALEDRFGQDPSQAEIEQWLTEFGSPSQVAARYHPSGSYLIGPALYPLFQLVAGITLAAVVGAQILAWVVALIFANEPFLPLEALAGLLTSVPSALGMVVIVFAILQWFEVKPELNDKPWHPDQLPQIEKTAPIKRSGKIFEIGFAIVILVILLAFPQWVGFVVFPGGHFFANPVIGQYLGWISFSLLVGIALDIYLLWQGRWSLGTRIAKLASNLLTIAILALLVQGHSAWLAAHGSAGFMVAIEMLEQNALVASQLVGMHAFRLAFVVALVVITIETLVSIVRMLRPSPTEDFPQEFQALD